MFEQEPELWQVFYELDQKYKELPKRWRVRVICCLEFSLLGITSVDFERITNTLMEAMSQPMNEFLMAALVCFHDLRQRYPLTYAEVLSFSHAFDSCTVYLTDYDLARIHTLKDTWDNLFSPHWLN